jgi:hypothetical protein
MNRLVLPLLALLTSCAALSPKGAYVDKPGLSDAIATAWMLLGRHDSPPAVRLVEEEAFTCTVPANGSQGFLCFDACVNGCTKSPLAVEVGYRGLPWSQSSLAHEYLHARFIREALAEGTVGAALQLAADWNHTRREWQQGELLELVNAEMARRGM